MRSLFFYCLLTYSRGCGWAEFNSSLALLSVNDRMNEKWNCYYHSEEGCSVGDCGRSNGMKILLL